MSDHLSVEAANRFCDDLAHSDIACGKKFARKTSPGLCVKCKNLSGLTPGSSEYTNIEVSLILLTSSQSHFILQKALQCEDCGVWSHRFTSSICGKCQDIRTLNDSESL